MSIPLWLLPHLAPNLEVNVPDTGLISDIPKFTTLLDVFTPVDATVTFETVFFTTFFSYNFSTLCSTLANSTSSVLYFSLTPNFSLLLLFFSFNLFTTSSASPKLDTYSFSSLSTVIP